MHHCNECGAVGAVKCIKKGHLQSCEVPGCTRYFQTKQGYTMHSYRDGFNQSVSPHSQNNTTADQAAKEPTESNNMASDFTPQTQTNERDDKNERKSSHKKERKLSVSAASQKQSKIFEKDRNIAGELKLDSGSNKTSKGRRKSNKL
ncbi:hypothetical protein BDY21DRAFT_341652 [Lineolata rhizophorae]|uniref:Uncharacterized protein n=1 Tax=Lineolata rhizophorae TaxID=578093 RepID=A0A6A6P2U1_9PEZI|nr:hypothetical protein BDY21DRAFT_341652 [Lineolata rhizophorae]